MRETIAAAAGRRNFSVLAMQFGFFFVYIYVQSLIGIGTCLYVCIYLTLCMLFFFPRANNVYYIGMIIL